MRIPKGTFVTVLTINGEKLSGMLRCDRINDRDSVVLTFGKSGTFTIPRHMIVYLEAGEHVR
jgi:hypothetical protein